MNRRAVLLLAAAAALVAGALLTRGRGGSAFVAKLPAFRATSAKAAPTPAGNAPSGYDNFKLLHTRNIFDPDRRPLRTGPAPTPPPPAARTEFVALTGTFFDGEQKQLAFFTGSRPEYNKVLTVRDQIAGATINKITGMNVEVERNGRPVTVGVGQTVPFDNSAPTAAPAPEAPAPTPAAATATTSTATTSAPAPAAPGNPTAAVAATANGTNGAVPASPAPLSASKQDDVRRRMEERRRQEQK